jgi:hypothetical protein
MSLIFTGEVMEITEKRITELQELHKIKRKQLRILKRRPQENKAAEERAAGLVFGSIWGVNDHGVPFDGKREDDHYKNTLRPCLALETPDDFEDHSEVWIAPGTTHSHPVGRNYPPCFMAETGREDIRKTTWFLLYFQFPAMQKTLEKRFTELSAEGKQKVRSLMEGAVDG